MKVRISSAIRKSFSTCSRSRVTSYAVCRKPNFSLTLRYIAPFLQCYAMRSTDIIGC
jgi:hypothetical protein